ncbi:hypothetical protein [Chitinophaga sp. CF118]|uniref:hypothetical protein n=1 Tax=Chitinophaga sp. CF118 TaxID=1884367 RepID=UPI002100DC61|nr:hypothetical protein [Chitinophaga sp. CF118]
MENLKDKVAVIFAASGEIAGAVARSFAQHGAKVYVTAMHLENLTYRKPGSVDIKRYLRFSNQRNLPHPGEDGRRCKTSPELFEGYDDQHF